MKVTAKVFDKQGNELYFKDLKDLLHYKDPVYNKDGDELCFNEEGTAEVLSKGFIDIPRVAHVSFCPYCYACKNVFFDEQIIKYQCRIYGDLPRDILFDHNQSCGYFQIDRDSRAYKKVKQQLE
jgi:hypothetical protein